MPLIIAVLVAFTIATAPAGASTAQAFYQQLITAVESDDITALAALSAYPLYYGNDSNRTTGKISQISNRQQLQQHYTQIFTPTIKRILACRTAEDFVSGRDGINVGNGSVWFAPVYIGSSAVAKPLDSTDTEQYKLKLIAVFDGAHAADDAATCETQKHE